MSVGTTLSNTTNIAGTPLYIHGNVSASGDLSVFGEVVHLEGTDPRLKITGSAGINFTLHAVGLQTK